VVSFRVVVQGDDGWIDQIQKTGVKSNTPPTTGPFRAVRDVEPLNEGDRLPEYHLTNQLGQAISTAQFKGQALAITFLFTRCPFPNFCPLMANNFSQAAQKLRANPNAPTNWHLLTVTFDPENDTPEVLRAYAEAHHADPAHSTFATGDLLEITALGEQFGLAFWKEQGSIINHNLRTIVIDSSGRVQKIFNGNTWQPEDLVAELIKAAKVPQ
jgi:protein SCO1